MSDIDLQHRMTTSVETVNAPSDLVDRVRQAGARRLRRRRFTAAAAVALSAVVVAGVATTGLNPLIPRSDNGVAATAPATDDTYGSLLSRPTGGDLAGYRAYLDEALAVWDKSHQKSQNRSRGVFDDLRGKAKVAWAGNTPAGRAAIVVQQSYLRQHDDLQLNREGLYTLIGFIGDGADSHPTLVADGYPQPKSGLLAGFVTGLRQQALIVLDTGQSVGWSPGRRYAADGSSRRTYAPLKFTDGVSVMAVPPGTDLGAIRISQLPVPEFSGLSVAGIPWPDENAEDPRLWPAPASWPLGTGAEVMRKSAAGLFSGTLHKVADRHRNGAYDSLWHAYGKTADGSQLVIGELALDTDPTRLYAVLKNSAGTIKVVPGGEPDKAAVLPVALHLPDGQGWAVARKGAQLRYRVDGGAWSRPRANAVLVPEGTGAEVKVTVDDKTQTVDLH